MQLENVLTAAIVPTSLRTAPTTDIVEKPRDTGAAAQLVDLRDRPFQAMTITTMDKCMFENAETFPDNHGLSKILVCLMIIVPV